MQGRSQDLPFFAKKRRDPSWQDLPKLHFKKHGSGEKGEISCQDWVSYG